MKKAASLTYEKSWYSPVYLRHLISTGDEAKVRAEYTRLRDIAQKRLKRLEKAGLTDVNIYKQNIKHYPVLKNIKSTNELSSRLADLSRFVAAEKSTVSGFKRIRAKTLSTLHEHGYDFVNEANLQDFGNFMEEYRFQKLDEIYDSGEAADSFPVTVKHHISVDQIRKDFDYWLENRKVLKSMRSLKKDWGKPDQIKKRAERKKKRGR